MHVIFFMSPQTVIVKWVFFLFYILYTMKKITKNYMLQKQNKSYK